MKGRRAKKEGEKGGRVDRGKDVTKVGRRRNREEGEKEGKNERR